MISIAPMLGLTTRHCCYFFRLLTKHALLYTEMISTGAILNNNKERILQYDQIEHPFALQLGGSDPKALAACAKIGEDFGYDEINLNAGCPSARVQAGEFGACLMLKPELVAECVFAMQKNVKIPVTVKTRLGVEDSVSTSSRGLTAGSGFPAFAGNDGEQLLDEDDAYERLYKFIKLIPAPKFIIHARKAYLKKSPKENRKINPSLNYQIVHQLKKDFPQLNFVLNGGFTDYAQMKTQLQHVDGIMVGRKAYRAPYFLANIDQEFYGETKEPKPRAEIVAKFMVYAEKQIALGENISHVTKPLSGLFHGISGAKNWRNFISSYCRTSA